MLLMADVRCGQGALVRAHVVGMTESGCSCSTVRDLVVVGCNSNMIARAPRVYWVCEGAASRLRAVTPEASSSPRCSVHTAGNAVTAYVLNICQARAPT